VDGHLPSASLAFSTCAIMRRREDLDAD